ncbi:serine protease [Roseomonas sp. GC11]|uniref:trypsin-like peptidase domain-containing protein n=1 Tax=Roseomonas sp. GC11 TaxID=2950546 RepID=UPI0021099D71|nr:serine protease [Roseomonas sp. GC11]
MAVLLLGACATAPSPPSAALPPTPPLPGAAPFLATLRAGTPGCTATGSAIHLGGGYFVTAAHLVDGTQSLLRRCPATGHLVLRLGGGELAAQVVRQGQADLRAGLGTFYLGGADAALLRAPEPPGLPALSLCASGPVPGQAVRLLTARRDATARIAGLMREADPAHGGYAELALPLEPGESGGAVLDAADPCLLGLISHREDAASGTRTRIVPAEVMQGLFYR